MAARAHATKPSPRARREAPPRAFASEYRRLERIFSEREWVDRRALTRARRSARERAHATLESELGGPDRARVALRLAAAELLGSVGGELADAPDEAAAIIGEIQEALDVDASELALEVLRAPEVLALAPPRAVRSLLAMLLGFAGLRGVSLWMRDTAEQVDCTFHVGDGGPGPAARRLAIELMAGETAEAQRRTLLGVAVGRQPQPLAALVASGRAETRVRARMLMNEVAPLLAAILERDALLTNNAESQRSLIESSERKLTRLGFDLHDGPIQDVAVLADDVRLLGDQLDEVIKPERERSLVRGRLEDVEAQLVAIDSELRRLSGEVNAASVLLNRPFDSALRDRVRAFVVRTGIEPEVHIDGPMNFVSTSQQIALLNIVHESLNNVREHASATEVQVTVQASANGVTARVQDNGRGFDLESTLMRAAREGRVGLLGIHERVRLLGGQCRIQSRPGGPTVVSIELDLWQPLVETLDAGEAWAG
jgi:signal transduction histidine kinase